MTLANDGGKDGCPLDTSSVPAGPVTFKVTNASAPGITEMELLKDQRIVGEKENLAPGLDPVSFTVTLDGGPYKVYCPGAASEYVDPHRDRPGRATPTGTVQTSCATAPRTTRRTSSTRSTSSTPGVKALDAAMQSGNVEQAKAAYAKARPFYERPRPTSKASCCRATPSTTTRATSTT